MHRFRSWTLDPPEYRTQRNRLLPIEGGDGSTLNLDFTTGVLDPRLTFSRTSDATFINSSGLVQYADANYLAQSETLSGTPWSTNGVSNTSVAVTNPVGGSDSRLISVTASGGSKSHVASVSVASGFQYTVRIWMRAGNSTSAAFGFLLGSFVTVTPSIVSGPGSVSGTTVCTVTGLTSAWTQVQMVLATTTSAGTGGIYIYPNAIANSIGDSIHLWGAQMNIGNTADPYYTTTANPYYAPRFDYDPTTLAPRGLLVEGTATNLARRSDDFNTTVTDGTQWVAAGYTAGTLSTTLPDGTTGNARRISTASGSGSFRSADITVTASTAYTFSFWARNNGGSQARFRVWNVTAGSSIVDYTQSINNYVSQIGGANNTSSTWVRVSVQFTTPAGCTAIYVYPTSSDSGTVDLLIWGAQLEAGSVATSYIPTGGSTGNRTAESLSLNTSNWYSPTYAEGTFYFRGSILNTATGYTRLFALTASSSVVTATGTVANFNIGVAASNSNRPFLNTFNTSNNDVDIYVPVGAAVSNNVEFGVTAAYKSGDWRISSKNLAATSTYATVSYATWGNNLFLSGINTIQLPAIWYKHLKFYPIRLPNSQMDTLSA